MRGFFTCREFLEVETPSLQISPGHDTHTAVFATELVEPFEQAKRSLYLHTSPEFTMKKLLAAGLPRIFQIARVYRNGERSPIHHPEFTMLEWYRAGVGYSVLMEDCEALLQEVMMASGCSVFSWHGKICDPYQPWQRLSVIDAFYELAGVDLLATITDSIDPDPTPLAEAACLSLLPTDRWEDVFFRVMLERIEPHLGYGKPVILYDYPLPLAALACSRIDEPRLVERFEVYVCGIELANACSELVDPDLQRARFYHEATIRKHLYGTSLPIDEDFLSALAYMPPSAGIALGLDRLVMLAVGARSIDHVLWAPVC